MQLCLFQPNDYDTEKKKSMAMMHAMYILKCILSCREKHKNYMLTVTFAYTRQIVASKHLSFV